MMVTSIQEWISVRRKVSLEGHQVDPYTRVQKWNSETFPAERPITEGIARRSPPYRIPFLILAAGDALEWRSQ